MVKIVVSDFDGTLVQKGADIVKGINHMDIASINAFTKQGGLFLIATGRHPDFIRAHFITHIHPYAVIGFSGNIVYHKGSLYGTDFTSREIMELEDFRMAYKDIVDIFICSWDNDYYFTGKDSFAFARKNKTTRSGMVDYNTLKDETIDQFLYTRKKNDRICRVTYTFPDLAKMERTATLFHKELGHKYDLIPTGPVQFEIARKGVNKASRIKEIAKEMGIGNDEIAVIGDDKNDIPMYRQYANSFCINTAEPAVRKEANILVDSVTSAMKIIMK